MNSDFTSKDTSLWSSGICIVLMASIKFSVFRQLVGRGPTERNYGPHRYVGFV